MWSLVWTWQREKEHGVILKGWSWQWGIRCGMILKDNFWSWSWPWSKGLEVMLTDIRLGVKLGKSSGVILTGEVLDIELVVG